MNEDTSLNEPKEFKFNEENKPSSITIYYVKIICLNCITKLYRIYENDITIESDLVIH